MNDQFKKILVTGGAGFIGSNFLLYMHQKYPQYHFINLDSLTYASDLSHLFSIKNSSRYQFIKGDITDRKFVNDLIRDQKFFGVINFAAESHVDNSINDPEIFIRTNINGTFNLLNACKSHWLDSKFQPNKNHLESRFLQISTDEVYGSLGDKGYFTEETPFAPNSPYSASKASADMLVRSFGKTYGLHTMSTHCSNNYGPHQHDEKLIPVIIRSCIQSKPIPIYGNGKNVRDWLHVLDHCRGIDEVFHRGESGERYKIGGTSELSNLELAQKICSLLNEILPNPNFKNENLISFVQDRAGHDFRYAIDFSKMKKKFNWQPTVNLDKGLTETINWYLKKYHQLSFK